MSRIKALRLILACCVGSLFSQVISCGKSNTKKDSAPKSEDPLISANDLKIEDTGCKEFTKAAMISLDIHVEYGPESFEKFRHLALVKVAEYLKATTPSDDVKLCADFESLKSKFTDKEQTIYALAFDAFLQTLDPHSIFLPTKRSDAFTLKNKGKQRSSGVFIEGRRAHEWVPLKKWVVGYIAPMSAALGLISENTEIDQINGIPLENKSITDLAKETLSQKSPENTVEYTLKNKNAPVTISLKEIDIPGVHGSAKTEGDKKIGWVHMRSFTEPSANEFRQTLLELEPKVQGYVLDLRNNSGGYLDSATEMLDDLIDIGPKFLIMTKKGLLKDDDSPSVAGQLTKKPIVVITDSGSASASDDFVGALRSSARAIHVGETSFGKGTAFKVYPVKGKFIKGSALITTSRIYQFDGSEPQLQGYTPHLELLDPLMQQALQLKKDKKVDFVFRETDYPNALKPKPASVTLVKTTPKTMDTILDQIQGNDILNRIKQDCDWENSDCQKILAIEVLKKMIDEKIVF